MKFCTAAFQFKFGADHGALMAGAVLNILPMMITFNVLRRQSIETIAFPGIKG